MIDNKYGFIEVIKQLERMCDTYDCNKCPLNHYNNSEKEYCNAFIRKHSEEAMQVILKWSEENPEKRYPTWREWQKDTFTTADYDIFPCSFLSKNELQCDGNCFHNKCLDTTIPYDIAEKLNIKPINHVSKE